MIEKSSQKCRTCLNEATEIISLGADHVVCDKVMSVSDLIKKCASVQIDIGDCYPQFVCIECIRSAEKSYSFRLLCEQSDISLKTDIKMINAIDEGVGSNVTVVNESTLSSEVELSSKVSMNKHEEVVIEEVILTEDIKVLEVDISRETCLEIISSYDETILQDPVTIRLLACPKCDLTYATAAELKEHISDRHTPVVYYKCPYCTVRFSTQSLLNKHIVKHTLIKKDVPDVAIIPVRRKKTGFKCAVCSKLFSSISELRQHVPSHDNDLRKTKQVGMECRFCGMKFNSGRGLQKHMQSHTARQKKQENSDTSAASSDINDQCRYKCKHCDKVFTTSIDFNMHLKDHVENKNNIKENPLKNKVTYTCNKCEYEFNTLTLIKEHLSDYHLVHVKEIFQNLSYKCSECKTKHDDIYQYFQHVQNHNENGAEAKTGNGKVVRKRPYNCNECGKAFPSPSAVRNHMRTHEIQWPKKCKYCSESIEKRNEYMHHLNTAHENMKTFVCSQCGKRFFKERNLEYHTKIHSGERNFMCDICGFSFHAQNNLVAHRRIHTGVKPYKCTFCTMSFPQHAGLRSHLLNHTGEKKYECTVCHKKFLRINAMKTHMKTHTGVRDYACHLCEKRFAASSTRKKHLLTHTGERNHICDFCGKAFSRSSNLNVHRKIHTGETPHVCEICGKGFIQAHVLRSHRNTHKKLSTKGARLQLEQVEHTDIDEGLIQTESSEEVTILVDLRESDLS